MNSVLRRIEESSPPNAIHTADFGMFDYRRAIPIPNSMTPGVCGANLPDFPVLVKITDATLKSVSQGGHVQSASGYDIIFRAADGETWLDHEIEKYIPNTGELIAWVRIPTLSYNGDTLIYVYYGGTGRAGRGTSRTPPRR